MPESATVSGKQEMADFVLFLVIAFFIGGLVELAMVGGALLSLAFALPFQVGADIVW